MRCPIYWPHPGEDLNIQSAQATFDGTNFEFTSTMDAAIGATSSTTNTELDVYYVWGIDRGLLSNEALFGANAPNILFDAVVVFDDIGGTPVGFVLDFANGDKITPLAPGTVTVSGDTIGGTVPGGDLPSMEGGSKYLVNLWTRQGIMGGFNQIAEFAPANGDSPISVTPEPAGVGLSGLGMLGLVALARRCMSARA